VLHLENRSEAGLFSKADLQLLQTFSNLAGTAMGSARLRERTLQAEKLSAMGTLAGGIAHEFNNMLGGIRGCAEDALEEEDAAEVREALRVILKTSGRACEIVENLLRFARKSPARLERFPLAEAARDTLRLLEGEFARCGIAVEPRLDEGAFVSGDPSKLQQVFLNLLTNAVHALDAAADKRIRITVRREGGGVYAEVSDSGPGIPPEIAERIFEPFVTTKDGRGPSGRVGTGLGLSVTYGILEAHGGSIEARPGGELGGATFAIRLPPAPEGGDAGGGTG
jgi:two-component system NtrC family sensor kinase